MQQEYVLVSHNTSLWYLLRSLYLFSCFLKTGVLDLARRATLVPDVRDRGFLYWRWLSTDPEAATPVAWSDEPVIFLVPRGHSFWNSVLL